MTRILPALAFTALWPCVLPAATDVVERPFAPGGKVRLDLHAGSYCIHTGSDPNKLKITWTTRHDQDRGRVNLKADTRGTEARVRISGPSDNFKVDIELPARTDLDVDMTVGELNISGIEGHKKLDLNIGEIRVDVGSAEDYREARGSVRIGELQAGPFGAHKEGFFRSFRWEGNGKYALSARLGIGEIRLTSSR